MRTRLLTGVTLLDCVKSPARVSLLRECFLAGRKESLRNGCFLKGRSIGKPNSYIFSDRHLLEILNNDARVAERFARDDRPDEDWLKL